MDYYQSEAEIEAVVQGFESCGTAPEEFNHRSHLTVAVWYLKRSTPDEAVQKMRGGLFRFLDHHGVGRGKYHETLTIFWIKLVWSAMDEMENATSMVQATNSVIERLSDPRVISEYYSADCLKSEAAKNGWVEPDRKSLEVL